jgi:anti-sigma factor RsiW
VSPLINCKECLDFIADYLDGEVTPEAAEQFEKHLKACPPCREYIESYKATIQLERESLAVRDDECRAMPESLVQAICRARKSGAE